MPQSLKALRRRVKSISGTKQLTRAMEMVAASKLRRAQGALLAGRPYAQHLALLLGRLAPAAEVVGHPLFAQRKVKRAALVLFTSDRGLCGTYNSNIIKAAEQRLRDQRLGSLELICVGRKGADYFSRRAWPIAHTFVNPAATVERALGEEINTFLVDRFLNGTVDEVFLLYNSFVSASTYRTAHEKFLDLDQSSLMRSAPPAERIALDYIFEPDQATVFERMVPAYLRSKLYITLAEALSSEHSARMLAMHNASENCDELVDSLTLELNKARQSAITNELLDIVGGAEALQG